ncbi:MAG TPA: UbiA-like polyprenyltransferase [Puia sp.]|nr:UbiA-like polyprenyltransferase [Puia sp.]
MATVKNYLSLIKFSHTIFAMPFAMIGFFLGINYYSKKFSFAWRENNGQPESGLRRLLGSLTAEGLLLKLILVILCMILVRSAAMSFNRYLDRNFDARNPRTAVREIPKGIISAKNALLFALVSCALFLITCFFINNLCFYLSPVALVVVLGYSYTKRFTPLCHLVLGIGLSLAPIGAYLAITGSFALLPILFSFTVIFWVSGFDIIYALQDEEFDKSNQLYSMPSWLGKSKALRVSEFLHLLSFGCVIAAGIFGQFSLWYWIGVCVFTGMLIYQHSIVRPNDLSKVNLAFMTANGIASVVFAVFVIADLFVHRV